MSLVFCWLPSNTQAGLITLRPDLQDLFRGPRHPIDVAMLAQDGLAPFGHVTAKAAKFSGLIQAADL